MSKFESAADWRPPKGLDALADPAIYARYRRLFARALSRLATSGFPAPPDEGLDLIHGFFAELWNEVAPRHDPMRAKFDTYIYGCFVNYARPRIVRLRRMRGMLVEPTLSESALAARSAPDEHETEPLDLAAVRQAVGRLPGLARSILKDYLRDRTPSERELAAKFGLTRYAIRMQLSDAVGSVMVALGDLEFLSDKDRSIARSLFGDRRTVRETARLLGREIAEIQDARTGWLGLLIQAVKGNRSMDNKRYAPPPIHQPAGPPAADLLMAALRPEAGEAADAAIRENRDAIWRFLDEPEAERLLTPFAESDPIRLAQVYGLLAADDDGDHQVDGEYDDFLSAREKEERMIGEAFAVLVGELGDDEAQLWRFFGGLPEVPIETQVRLRKHLSVLAAGEWALDLVRYGITPVTIAEASGSVSSLALRFCRQNAIEAGDRIVLERTSIGRTGEEHRVLRRKETIENLLRGIDLPPIVVEKVYDWMLDVSSYTPLFFKEFAADGCRNGVTLKKIDDESDANLLARWSPAAAAQVANLGYASSSGDGQRKMQFR